MKIFLFQNIFLSESQTPIQMRMVLTPGRRIKVNSKTRRRMEPATILQISMCQVRLVYWNGSIVIFVLKSKQQAKWQITELQPYQNMPLAHLGPFALRGFSLNVLILHKIGSLIRSFLVYIYFKVWLLVKYIIVEMFRVPYYDLSLYPCMNLLHCVFNYM